ncbi:Leucine-rich repeat family protein [Perilla frutescens var. hirtella]|uniref:Leucine-rich repeat family protein n=1 Tax=Perilla frutescens var. hirtella TaxID=608512 RepID=A0AAD4P294_PERFH|nr:Leucine-rich repeat family protein [Perilla frutescens var. hirtella]
MRKTSSFIITLHTLIFILLFPIDNQLILAQSEITVGVGGRRGGAAAAAVKIDLPPLQNPLFFLDQRLAIVGFFCESPPDNRSAIAVASIDFNGFQLSSPTLVGFLDGLPDLALFHANSNYFSGEIPPAIARLPYLYELDISNNRFSGPFPTAILAMDGLSFLDIRFNSFSGSVPPQLFSKNLDLLFLNNNNFMTRLPDNTDAAVAHVAYLTLANNKLFGPIPHSIATSLAGLSEVLLLNNLLSGCLPYELGLLKDAVVFDAGNNNLTGPLPFSLGCLEKLEVLNFAGNMLYGQVPEPLCRLGNLRNLSLSDNYFTGAGPTCMRLIESGVLDMRKNCIPGEAMQRSAAECAAFMAVPKYCPYSNTKILTQGVCRYFRNFILKLFEVPVMKNVFKRFMNTNFCAPLMENDSRNPLVFTDFNSEFKTSRKGRGDRVTPRSTPRSRVFEGREIARTMQSLARPMQSSRKNPESFWADSTARAKVCTDCASLARTVSESLACFALP